MDGFALSVCKRCGAGYADGIPPQSVFDRYYAEMSKYERSQGGGELNDVDAGRYRQTADLLVPHLCPGEAIVDVGCATGALLAELKRRGFGNLLGIDPSPACAKIGRCLYDITIRNMPGSRLSEVAERFDPAILSGVLEHLCAVGESLDRVIGLLKPGGKIYIEVPDATRYSEWFSAPFQFFSMEHVNYFSPQSLTNLMSRLGLQPEFVTRVPRWLGPSAGEPAIAGLFRYAPSKGDQRFAFDAETEPALNSYIHISQGLESHIHLVINKLAKEQTPLVVWGAGTHTLRLMETSALPDTNLLAFIDSNSRYHGKMLRGIPILAPYEWQDPLATILISSHVAEQEIRSQITDALKWKNPLICLYEGGSPNQGIGAIT
jgi:SAM-dependent methyltransferase